VSAPSRPLYQIADEIKNDWNSHQGRWGGNYAAVPYLEAMGALVEITDTYICESGESIVRYFLSNAKGWRGDTARRIKAELKALLP
jgi:hypothetical protein